MLTRGYTQPTKSPSEMLKMLKLNATRRRSSRFINGKWMLPSRPLMGGAATRSSEGCEEGGRERGGRLVGSGGAECGVIYSHMHKRKLWRCRRRKEKRGWWREGGPARYMILHFPWGRTCATDQIQVQVLPSVHFFI